ncbi:hypothetical protein EC988_001487, partial [Linderina pennispora]
MTKSRCIGQCGGRITAKVMVGVSGGFGSEPVFSFTWLKLSGGSVAESSADETSYEGLQHDKAILEGLKRLPDSP